MTKATPLLILASLGCAACAQRDQPRPAPDQVRQLLAELEARPEARAAADLPPTARDKAAQADRMVGSLEKVQPEKIDPAVAAALIQR